MTARPVVVVKLGGSLHGHPDLARWLDALRAERTIAPVVVPGGGPFADQVRRSQVDCGFDDATAHRMALRAMDQFGLLMAGLAHGVQTCADPAAFAGAWAGSRLPVWLPSLLLEGQTDLPWDWSVTSDSIAAWLAARIGAAGLLLVKSCDLPAAAGSGRDAPVLAALAAAGVVDEFFPKIMKDKRFAVLLRRRSDWAATGELARRFIC